MNSPNARKILLLSVVALLLLPMFAACNAQKKNTALSRNYTAFITRYNIYYNGDKHYKETLKDMEDKYEDDYSRILFMHPIEAKTDPKAPQPQGDFNRSIEKAQKAIQVRSIKKKPVRASGSKTSNPKYKAWMKRDEYNPFLHNAWMMMGRSQYYNGDFLGAASTFMYVSKHFTWLPQTVTEAKLWMAQSYISLDWLYEGEVIITRIKEADLTNKTLKRLYNTVFADFEIKSEHYDKAIPYLQQAIKLTGGAQKSRMQFLLGQLYARVGEKELAYKAFKAAGSSSSLSYRTKFNARIKQSEVFQGDNIEPEVKALKRMTRYDRNKEYLDQVYYAIGNLYLSRGDTARAIENYELAAEKSTRNGIDKAINQITLGELYFKKRNYQKAQPCYAEAIPLLPENYPDYKLLKRRSEVLDELAVYSGNVNLQDSLLHLSTLSEDEQLSIVKKIIEDLKKKEKEEAENARREEFMANQATMGNQLKQPSAAATPATFNLSGDNSWYFYNASVRNAGKADFQKRWGSRKLEDDWRRRNKASFSMSDFDSSSEEGDEDGELVAPTDSVGAETPQLTSEEQEKKMREDDPHYPEFYLKQIPKTDEEKATSHEVIQEGLYNMGVILKDKLEDFGAAQAEFDRLLTDYPDNIYRLDTYYNLYLMYMRQGNKTAAERYRELILSDFADSQYGQAMRDPEYLDKLRQMDAEQQKLYDRTYQDYLDNRNSEVHAAYAEMQEKYPLSKIMPKFMFLDALAYVTEKNSDKFKEVLREMLEKYPQTDITPVASAWLKGLAQGRELRSTSSNIRGMLWDIRLGNDSTAVAGADTPVNFEIKPDDPQLLLFVYPTDEVDANKLLYEVARHNFNSFVVKDFDLEQMNFGRLGMLIVKGFDNVREVDHYRKVMSAASNFKLPQDVRPIPISAANFEKLITQGRTLDDYFRFLQELDYEQTQAAMLQPEDVETLSEAEEAAEADAAAAAAVDDAAKAEETEAAEVAAEAVAAEISVDEKGKQPAPTSAPHPAQQAEQPMEKVAEKAAEQPAEKAVEKSPEKVAEKADEQPAEKAVEKAPEKVAEKAAEQPAEKAVEKAPEKPATPLIPPVKPKQPAKKVVKEKEPAVIPTLPAKPQAPKRAKLPVYTPGSEGDDDPLLD